MKTETFPVVELFDSIEGEGKRTGYMAVFVRFAGCNLRCSYCDTGYALERSDARNHLTEGELLERIRSYPWKKVTLTGGEPLLQPLDGLCRALSREGYEVNIETNGAVPLLEERPKGLFYTMDVKSLSSGMRGRMRMENLTRLTGDDVVKFVVGSREDLLDMEQVLQEYTIRSQVYVSPVYGAIEPKELVEFVRDHKLAQVCIQVQLHKIIWDPEMRGV